MILHYRELGNGKPLMILHGLFGFSDNWQTHAKKFSEYFRVILVDLRNHGHSPWSEAFSYELMASDIHDLQEHLHLEKFILLGHSMGGKVAMHYAQRWEDRLEKLIIVDIGVKEYPMHHQHILEGMHAVQPEKIMVRSEAEQILRRHIESEGVIQFLLKNLYWKEKGLLAWRMNLPVLEREMNEILSGLPAKEVMTPTLFIRGAMSNYILDEDWSDIAQLFPDAYLDTIPEAGHWVHAEQPEVFIDAVLSFCLR
jgi:esterase